MVILWIRCAAGCRAALTVQCNVKTTDSEPSSDSKEAPLQTAHRGLSKHRWVRDGFYRDDAKLYVILVTDEEDQSDGTPQLYVDFFRTWC